MTKKRAGERWAFPRTASAVADEVFDNHAAARYVAILDVLGFQDLLERGPELAAREVLGGIEMVIGQLNAMFRKVTEPPGRRMFQDTVVLWSADNRLGELVLFTSDLVRYSFFKGVFLRGAVGYGPVFVDDYAVVGAPIPRIYRKSQEQEWVGVWVDDTEFTADGMDEVSLLAQDGHILSYPVPLKTGTTVERWAINWPRPEAFNESLTAGVDLLNGAAARNSLVKQKAIETVRFLKSLGYSGRNTEPPSARRRKASSNKDLQPTAASAIMRRRG